MIDSLVVLPTLLFCSLQMLAMIAAYKLDVQVLSSLNFGQESHLWFQQMQRTLAYQKQCNPRISK